MRYKPLKIVKYENIDYHDIEYKKRIESFGTIITDMHPILMKREKYAGADYPLFVVPLQEIQLLIQKIVENSIEITQLSGILPPVAKIQFYKEQLYKAIISSNEIEGVRTTRSDVSEAFESLKKKKSKRLKSTVRMYHDIADNEFLKIDRLDIVRYIYDMLTEGEIDEGDKLDGDLFRDSFTNVIDNSNGIIEHIPPSSEKTIFLMLTSWINFINDKTVPFMIKAMLAHYFFENIHPFYDGNGRTGRYILSRYLSRKLDVYSGLVITQKINENKKKYYDAFKTTGDIDNRGEGTFFVLSMLEILYDGQLDVINILKEKKLILDSFWDKMDEDNEYTELQKNILFLLLQSKVFVDDPTDGIKDNDIIDTIYPDAHKKTIKDNIIFLRNRGIIEQVSKSPSRHRLSLTNL